MAKRPAITISDELVSFLDQGVSLLVGTCDAAKVPHVLRAVGLRVHDDRRHVTVYLPEVASRHTVTDVAVNPLAAVTASQLLDHRSVQLKGRVTKVEPAGEREREHVESYLASYGRKLEVVGMTYEIVTMLSHWPAVALELEVEAMFLQTPGPGAGQPLAGQAV